MSKIKVVHHSKYLGYSGTDRTAQLFCKYLAQGDRFEPYLVYRGGHDSSRLDIVREWIGDDHVVPYEWIPGKKGRQPPYMPEHDNLHEVLMKINPGIVHMHRSGFAEWPGFKYMCPTAKWAETNIFGYNDNTPEFQFDINIYISEYIKRTALEAGNYQGPVLYNPIEQPVLDMTPENKELCRQYLLKEFKLPQNAILLGRVGRADNFDPISLKAFAEIEKIYPEAFYLVVNACDNWRNTVNALGIQNVRFIEPIIEDSVLSNFYQGLDIYAHARSDGECCPCNIQEAMMHGLPIVSHESAIHNGQSEIVATGGFVVPVGDYAGYRDVLLQLIENGPIENDPDHRIRDHFSREARRYAMRTFEASCITTQLESIYDRIL